MEKIYAILSSLEKSGVLNEADKKYIRKKYKEDIGTALVLEKKCSNCWHDAIDTIIAKSRLGKFRMKNGAVLVMNDIIYTCKNITDDIALELMKDEQNKKYFY